MQFKNNTIAILFDISNSTDLEELYVRTLGKKGDFQNIIKGLKDLPEDERKRIGIRINEIKTTIESEFFKKRQQFINKNNTVNDFFDVTIPGIIPESGHLHIVTQAIIEITAIFEKISFTRVRHPEVDWDYYAFEALNMPKNHPARDEWETFHIKSQIPNPKSQTKSKFQNIVLTPHTSNGQVREMEKGKLPIRMINIAKCYRRQIDVSHTPMFHQFEGLYIDKGVSIAHLKGICDYFFKSFYGPDRLSRLRPFHFQFTEPSFEIDVSCGICGGRGVLKNGSKCRLCKDGWLELGGAGMVHPNVLKAGGIDSSVYNGFAFGWGVERTYMMKADTQLNDIRPLYNNDIRLLTQF